VSLYRRIVTSSAIYSIGVFAPMAVSMVMLPVYTRYFSPSDYAVMDLIDTSRNLFSMLVGGRFTDALFYFYSQAKTDEDRKRTVSTAMLGSILVGLTGALIGALGSKFMSETVFQSDQYTFYFQLGFLTFGLSLPVEAALAWLRAIDSPVRYVAASIARLLVAVAFSATFIVGFRMGVPGFLWSGVLTHALLGLILTIMALSAVSLRFHMETFRAMVAFSIPLGLTGIALFVIHSGDRFFLQRYTSLAEIGLYSLAYKLGMLISYVYLSFSNFWSANMYSIVSGEKAEYIYARVNTYMMLVLSCGGLGIVLFRAPALHLLASPQFWPASVYVAWIALAYMIRAQGDYFRLALYLDRKVGVDARQNWIAAAFCLALYATLIPVFKVWGAIAATILTFLLVLVLAWRNLQRDRPYQLEWRRLWMIGGYGALLVFLSTLLPSNLPLFASAGAALVLLLAYPALLWMSGFADENERAALERLIGRAA
jgi:O-antigen/teichoic acid export membrane protein